ncbi:MAG: hypothetical protein J2P18_16130 [Nocardia sp.]|nr:hypothetical protein [Nocardia sp.]
MTRSGFFERGVLIELAPRGWLVLAAVAVGVVIFVALLVMALVSGHKFNDPTKVPMPPRGTCTPFCYSPQSPGAPLPGPEPQYPIPAA